MKDFCRSSDSTDRYHNSSVVEIEDFVPAQQIDNFFTLNVSPGKSDRYDSSTEPIYEMMFMKKGFFYNEIKNIARECII